MSTPESHPQDLHTVRALASLEATADEWAEATGLTAIVAVAANVDDRESRIEALVKLAFLEGAYALLAQAREDGLINSMPNRPAAETAFGGIESWEAAEKAGPARHSVVRRRRDRVSGSTPPGSGLSFGE